MSTTPFGTGQGARVLDRYLLEAPLPARLGGQAWLAEDPQRGARVEVHLLEANPAREGAFPQVRLAIERLSHVPGRSLARPLQLEWDEEGRLVLVLEYHDGRALSTLLAHRPARPDEAREVLRGLLHALGVAARVGLHHGRLTPARVLLGAENQVALLDLGLSPLLEPAPQEAPWQAPGEARGVRADAYAVAVIGLELLCGARPERGRPLPVPAPAAEAVGRPFIEALERLARADGSAQVFDAGALLGLLPPRRTRARRSRYTLSEVWDGDIGGGTARLLKLALSPQYEQRMPEEIRGNPAEAESEAGRDELEFLSTLPGVFLTPRPAPTRAGAQAADPEQTLPPSVPAPTISPPPAPPATPAPAPTVRLPREVPGLDQETIEEPPPEGAAPGLQPGGPSGLTTLAPSAAPPPVAPPPAAPRHTAPLLLRAGRAPQVVFLIPARGGQARLGRERGNDLVLRAFKGQEVDGVDSNRISRRHVTFSWQRGAFQIQDEKSTYGSSLDGRRLGPGEATPLGSGSSFALRLGDGVLTFRGRCWPETGALRLLRDDATGHQYVALLGEHGTVVRVGSGADQDALLLPPEGGVRPGHALLRVDPASGALQIAAGEGSVSAGGHSLPPGVWADLIGVQLGGVRLAARTLSSPYDFFSPAASLTV